MQLIHINITTGIFVQLLESLAQVHLVKKHLVIQRCCDKLAMLNEAILIGVYLVKYLYNIELLHLKECGELVHAFFQLFNVESSIIVGIHLTEHALLVSQLV